MSIMKYALILFLVTKTLWSFGQKENDLGQLVNEWMVVAKLDSTNNFQKVKLGEFRFSFNLNLDSTVNYSEGPNYLKNMIGTWTINKVDKTLQINLTAIVPWCGTEYSFIAIQEKRTFKVDKINIYELILTQLEDNKKRTYFLKHEKI